MKVTPENIEKFLNVFMKSRGEDKIVLTHWEGSESDFTVYTFNRVFHIKMIDGAFKVISSSVLDESEMKNDKSIQKATEVAVANAIDGIYAASHALLRNCDTDLHTVSSVCKEEIEGAIEDAIRNLWEGWGLGSSDFLSAEMKWNCQNCQKEIDAKVDKDGLFFCEGCKSMLSVVD